MKKKTLQKAITLMELLVATIVVVIIMLGVVSIDRALRQSQRGTSRNALVSMRTSGIMLSITKAAQEATGDFTNLGIEGCLGCPTSIANTVCFRLDTNDPNTYADDTWTCFTQNGNNMERCAGMGAAAACSGGQIIGQLVSSAFTLEHDPSVGNYYLNIALVNRFDPTAAADAFDNPEFTLQTRVSPVGMGSSPL